MAVRAQREEKSNFVTKLEEVLPLLRERFGVMKIGIFGSTARGEDRPESDVDDGRKVDLLTVGGIDPLIRQDVESEVVWCEA